LKPIDQSQSIFESFQVESESVRIVDVGTNLTGFIGLKVKCEKPVRLFVTFDEILSDKTINFSRMGTINLVDWDLKEAGSYQLESFEPYTLRYLQIMSLGGDCTIQAVSLREYANPDVWQSSFACDDRRLNEIFNAARETFRQNALDVFMDCPSRERAGWLCDSFFTSRVAHDLSGNHLIEKNFLENFALAGHVREIPDEMLPMCYPSDHDDGVFIPQWAMWFVLQLEEYLARIGDRGLVDQLQKKIEKLLGYLERFHNSDGLLEKLESWLFVEWSKANEFVRDVNYPTNMLYAAVLLAAGRMYSRKDWLEQAGKIRDVVRAQSFDGEFFVDNALRDETSGKLNVTRNRSEVCQYFAFFFSLATPESHPKLWKMLTEEFGPSRKTSGKHPEIHFANAFVGNYLRLEILSRFGRSAQVIEESIGYFLKMAEMTGTLWENDSPTASCNHGFASHVAKVFYRDALGVRLVDSVNRLVKIQIPADVHLNWCEGRIPVPGGFVTVKWWKGKERIEFKIDAPSGYRVEMG
jgi:alpha-L-rhamnosidase